MRIQPAIGIHAGIEQQANVIAMCQDAVEKSPSHLAELLFAFRVPEKILAIFADGNVGVHAAAIHADDRLGQERCGEAHVGGDLAADQLVKLDLISGRDDFAVSVINFKLRRRDFRVIFLVLEAHSALHFSRRVDERAQRVAGQGMIVAAGIDVLEFGGFVIMTLGVGSFEEESFNFVGRVQRVFLLFVQIVGVGFQHAADVRGVRCAALIDNVAEHEDFARTKDIGRSPVESAPINPQAQVALALRGKAADRRSVKGQVVPALEQELLVIVEHVQPALEIGEQDGQGLDALLVG